MGYYSDYNITTDGTEMEEMEFLAALRRDTDAKYAIDRYGGSSGEQVTWYEWERDVAEMSRRFRNLAICVHRIGQEHDDEEYAYFLNGEVTKPKEVHFFSPSWEIWLESMGRRR